MLKDINPFISTGYIGPEYFCDRIEESKQLKSFITNGVNISMISIRRLGKTGLIHHVFNQIQSNSKEVCIYLDILSSKNLKDLTNQIATAVHNRFPPKNSLGRKITTLFQRFRPTITFDELTGTPALSLSLETQAQKENTIGNILQFLDKQGIQVVIAIDEFQQILEYPEDNTEAILRTYIQQLQHISFIFSGSNQRMMNEIFNSTKRPFYAGCQPFQLNTIPQTAYSLFIKEKFEERKKNISDDCITFICEWTELHTFYVQQLCFTLYAQNKKTYELKDAHDAALSIMQLHEGMFFQYRNLLTSTQWKLLCAIAKEEKVKQPQSKKFIKTYKLGTPAGIKRSLDALIKKELIYHKISEEIAFYAVYDKYLMRWIQSRG